MKRSIFLYTDYKTFLLDQEQASTVKGFRSRLAESTGCQNAFVSQVLNGSVNFSLEQGLNIARYFGLDEAEFQYFLWMIEYKRAGSAELRNYFLELMANLREKNLDLKERVKVPVKLSAEAQTKYYSSWLFSAIHIAVMVPKLNSVNLLAEVFGLSIQRTKEIVDFLVSQGLIAYHGDELKSGRVQMHLAKDSPHINKHHSNWRIEAISSLDEPHLQDLHYSGVSCLSRADVDKLRSLLAETIENYVRLVERSGDETLYVFNMDFFRLLSQ